jgi:hypothetical protein
MAVSMAPVAPMECPRVDFVAETITEGLIRRMAWDSGPSPAAVPVPWGTYETDLVAFYPRILEGELHCAQDAAAFGVGSVIL